MLVLHCVAFRSRYWLHPLRADDPPAISYYKDVRPIFQQNCNGCHQPAKPQGGYVMTEYADLLKAGERGKAGVVAGKPEASYLVAQITLTKTASPRCRRAATRSTRFR